MTIPKIQHRMWVGPPMPEEYVRWTNTWREMHPEWRHLLHLRQADLENQELYDSAHEIAPEAPEQFQADVSRYEILWRHGGVWLDLDIIPHQPIDPLLVHDAFVVSHAGRYVANTVLGFPPQHPAMREAIDALPHNVERYQDAPNTKRSGPQFLTKILRGYDDIAVLPANYFLPYEWNELEAHGERWGIYGTHVWNNQRRKRGIPLP